VIQISISGDFDIPKDPTTFEHFLLNKWGEQADNSYVISQSCSTVRL